jgi:hypothetical protein
MGRLNEYRYIRASGLDGVFISRMKFIDNNRDILLKKNTYIEKSLFLLVILKLLNIYYGEILILMVF